MPAPDKPVREGTREAELEAALRRLRMVTALIADEVDLDPEECVVTVNARGPNGERELARVSLAECFAEVDRLVPGGAP